MKFHPATISVNPRFDIVRVASITSVIVIGLTISDIILGTLLAGILAETEHSAAGIFRLFKENFWLGLYQLDFLNLIVTILMIPIYFVFFKYFLRENRTPAWITFLIFILGAVIFLTNNAALPMALLSSQYPAAVMANNTESYLATGQALLARGAHGSLGAFPGFFLQTLASILMSWLMLRSRAFVKWTGWFGIIGSTLLLIYLMLITFMPDLQSIALVMAAPGGILAIIWMILYTKSLFQWGH